MGSITLRVRSVVWFVTGAVVASMVTLMFVNAWRVDAAPGDVDATFVAITPCRLADTRPAPNRVGTQGSFGPSDSKTFQARGTNGECTIPADAVGLSLNVTAIGASERTFLTLWPGGDRPLASSLNPAPGQPPVPNAVTTELSGVGGLNVFNNKGRVNVVIDVNGYYTKTSLQELAQRLAAVEAATATNNAAQPFTVVSETIESVTAGPTVTEIVSVTVTAPVDGQVATFAAGYMFEGTDGQLVRCGLMDSVTEPTIGERLFWQSATLGDRSHLSATRVFDIAADQVATYYLVCNNTSAGATSIISPRVTAIFTPAP